MDATPDARLDATPGQRLRGQLLRLRGRAGLTQRALAALLGIGGHAIQKWEQGEGYPSPARLQDLIALYVQRGVFPEGREEAEARALWALLRGAGGPRTPPFDAAWFATLQPAAAVAPAAPTGAAPGTAAPGAPAGTGAAPVTVAPLIEPRAGPRGLGGPDWGDAPEVAAFQGRAAELATLGRWLREERCRVVALLGLGGIGKTALATRLAQDLAPQFEGLCWRSLRNAPRPRSGWGRPSRRWPRSRPCCPRAWGCCWRCRARGAACWCSTTWRRCWSRGSAQRATGRGTRATARCCGSWARAATKAVCC